MPANLIVNPANTNPAGIAGPTTGVLTVGIVNGDTVPLVTGNLVQIISPSTAQPINQFLVRQYVYTPGATTIAPLCIGIVLNGSPNQNPLSGLGNAYIPPGGVGEAVIHGWVPCLVDGSGGTPTAGHVLALGQTNGALADSGATTGTVNRNFGTILTTQNAFPTVSGQTATGNVLTLTLTGSLPSSANNLHVTGATGTTNNPIGEFTRTTNSFNPSNTSSTPQGPTRTYFTYQTTNPNDTVALNLGVPIGTLGGAALLTWGQLVDCFFRWS